METVDELKNYFLNIVRTLGSLLYGLKITFRHFLQARKSRKPIGVSDKEYFTQKDGIVTLQYPKEEFPVPDNGRYQLHNEIDDCIVCDKCAKVCPVNCIDIEPVRAVEEFGVTSDGTSKRIYAAKFDIDMSKCCFCGLCTVVCPTECLTMTKEFDFSVLDLNEHNFEFGDMSEELISEKKKEFEVFQAEKEKAKASSGKVTTADRSTQTADSKAPGAEEPSVTGGEKPKSKKPVFRPKVKGASNAERLAQSAKIESEEADSEEPKAKSPKPVFRPKIKKKEEDDSESPSAESLMPKADGEKREADSEKPKAKFRPKIKPKKKD